MQYEAGVTAIEDKIVQKVVAETILTPIYEAEFLGFSYGFRRGRGAHDALDALAVGLERRKIHWVADCDIRAFFESPQTRVGRGGANSMPPQQRNSIEMSAPCEWKP